MVMKKCKQCGKEFEAKGPQKYCSDKCFKEHRKEYKANRHKLVCDWCGKDFKGSYKEQRFCSTECQYEWQRRSKEYQKIAKNNRQQRVKISLKRREKAFKEKFNNKFDDFVYVGGYINSESKVKVKCKKCGYIQERHAQSVRASHSKHLNCDKCEEKRLKIKKKNENINSLIKLIKDEIGRRREHIKAEVEGLKSIQRNHRYYVKCKRCGRHYFSSNSRSVHCDKCIKEIKEENKLKRAEWEGKTTECEECGKEFEMVNSKSKFCSSKCLNKSMYRKREIERREKMKENGKVNYKISKTKLIRRDNGICQLCGKPIDKNDYLRTKEGHFVAGDDYPSIDHIVPVAKGGTHTWDNVQLAHFKCNSLKSDSLEFNSEQEEAS